MVTLDLLSTMSPSRADSLGRAALALVPLAMTLLNLATWPRGRRGGAPLSGVSILIPARNEEGSIEAAVRAAAAAGPSRSSSSMTDRPTRRPDPLSPAQRASPAPRGERRPAPRRLGRQALRVPPAREGARGAWFFMDADVALEPEALERLGDLVTRTAQRR